jgi:hypothetical protein
MRAFGFKEAFGAMVLVGMSLTSGAARGQPASVAGPPVRQTSASVAPGGCPESEVAGCNKGLWTLSRNVANALIAELDEPATYRVCAMASSQPVYLEVDGGPLHTNGKVHDIYPPVEFEQLANASCVIVSGKQIVVRTKVWNDPKPAHGYYQRLEEPNPFNFLFAFGLQKDDKDASAMLVATANKRLYRVCFGPIGIPSPPQFSPGKHHLSTEQGFVMQKPDLPRGYPFATSTCIDLNAKVLNVYGPIPAVKERLNGFVVY